jgi:glycine betaine/proline transport system substrate-binding protein
MNSSHNRRPAHWSVAGGSTALLAAMLGLASPASAESTDPIKLTLNDWTGQHISATIMGKVLESKGLSVEYVQADYIAQFAGLASGDLDVAMEIWDTTAKQLVADGVATGKIEDLGGTGMKAREEWWYPSYMKERCPGLPDWTALKSCAEAFSTPETAPKGRYVGGPVAWGGNDEERIAALGLDFEVVHPGTDSIIFAELESAYQRKAPIMIWGYEPHWLNAKYKGEFVEFPPYAPECYTDPAWGINPDATYDCGKPTGMIRKVAWSGVKEQWPTAYDAIKNFQISNAEMSEMVSRVDLKGEDLNTVVDGWIAANSAVWQKW